MDQVKSLINQMLVPRGAIVATLGHLRRSGERRHEGVVLWLGTRSTRPMHVKMVYEPMHRASNDFFHISAQGMAALMSQLERTGLSVLAQVHTHPAQAFHSKADDHWALVRHLGALSLVLPDFALTTTPENFLRMAATFALSPGNQWVLVPQPALDQVLELVP